MINKSKQVSSQTGLNNIEISQNTTSNTQKQNNQSGLTQEKKKINFIVLNSQQGQAELDFQKLMQEKLNKYRKNIRNLNIQYKINHYDFKEQSIKNQSIQDEPSFPKLLYLSNDKFFEQLKEQQKETQQNYDEILESDKLIMKLSFDKIEIYDQNGNLIESKNQFPFSIIQQSKEVKYNQIFGQKDVKLLLSTGMFVTSNVVDSYANYLRIKEEDEYFKLKAENRQKCKRTFIFCSDFITNCSINTENNKQKQLSLFYEYINNFESIQFQFWNIYQNIIFVVNQRYHWFIVKLDIEKKIMEIYDSIPKIPASYEKLQMLFQTIFSEIMKTKPEFKIKVIQEFPRQQDNYSCGYFSCIALTYLNQIQYNIEQQIQDKQKQKFISKMEIKQILRDLLIDIEDDGLK